MHDAIAKEASDYVSLEHLCISLQCGFVSTAEGIFSIRTIRKRFISASVIVFCLFMTSRYTLFLLAYCFHNDASIGEEIVLIVELLSRRRSLKC